MQCRFGIRSKYHDAIVRWRRLPSFHETDVQQYGHSMGRNTTWLYRSRDGSYPADVFDFWPLATEQE